MSPGERPGVGVPRGPRKCPMRQQMSSEEDPGRVVPRPAAPRRPPRIQPLRRSKMAVPSASMFTHAAPGKS